MTTYEKVVDGVVVERVVPVDGDYTDTQLGCMALEYTGGDGWRREGQVVEPPSSEDGQADTGDDAANVDQQVGTQNEQDIEPDAPGDHTEE